MTRPTDFNSPDFRGLGPGGVDAVARAVMMLARELCVVSDRLLVLEDVLAGKGLRVADAVDTHTPDAALQARIDARTEAIIAGVLKALGDL